MKMKSSSTIFFCLAFVCLGLGSVYAADNFTNEERKALKLFRPMVSKILYRDFMKEDNYLVSFLRSRNLNLEEAKEMMKKMVEWRKANKIDTILKEDFSAYLKDFPFMVDSVDKEGRPVLIVLGGQYNIRKVVLGGQTAQFTRFLDRDFELGREIARQKNVTQGIMIMDLNGFNRRTQACLNCIPVFVHFTRVYENYYPGLCNKFIFINAPQTWELVMEAIRPFWSTETRASIQLYGHNKDEYRKALLKLIDTDQLPVRFGGKKVVQFSETTVN